MSFNDTSLLQEKCMQQFRLLRDERGIFDHGSQIVSSNQVVGKSTSYARSTKRCPCERKDEWRSVRDCFHAGVFVVGNANCSPQRQLGIRFLYSSGGDFRRIDVAIRKSTQLPLSLLWLLSIWGLLHVVGGVLEVPAGWLTDGDKRSFYSWEIIPGILVYDKPVHAFGFGIATWACWCGISATCGSQQPTVGRLTLAALAGMGLGALNEVVEFIASQTMDTNVGGYVNTGGDLVANWVGAFIAVLLISMKTGKAQ
jgi:hypothetical protein